VAIMASEAIGLAGRWTAAAVTRRARCVPDTGVRTGIAGTNGQTEIAVDLQRAGRRAKTNRFSS